VEEGHFHESVNLAAIYRLPVLFICENNLYSSHLPLLDRRREDNIDRAGLVHAVPSERIDGNDVLEVHRAASAAVARLRKGGGPVLLECRTYRWRGHVGPSWDIDVGVKRKDELKDWLPKDPVLRLRKLLESRGVCAESFDREEAEIRREVEEAVEFARTAPYPPLDDLERHVYRDARGGTTS
jgi:pyruvate dehydrogenase E1 component alpha subunit